MPDGHHRPRQHRPGRTRSPSGVSRSSSDSSQDRSSAGHSGQQRSLSTGLFVETPGRLRERPLRSVRRHLQDRVEQVRQARPGAVLPHQTTHKVVQELLDRLSNVPRAQRAQNVGRVDCLQRVDEVVPRVQHGSDGAAQGVHNGVDERLDTAQDVLQLISQPVNPFRFQPGCLGSRRVIEPERARGGGVGDEDADLHPRHTFSHLVDTGQFLSGPIQVRHGRGVGGDVHRFLRHTIHMGHDLQAHSNTRAHITLMSHEHFRGERLRHRNHIRTTQCLLLTRSHNLRRTRTIPRTGLVGVNDPISAGRDRIRSERTRRQQIRRRRVPQLAEQLRQQRPRADQQVQGLDENPGDRLPHFGWLNAVREIDTTRKSVTKYR
ncbi:hypothetical protein LV35_04177 [Acinetobacter baumannii]|uniref:Uncharacterized protein n=1 Tax=Acinetobacter baumannii TaxID=470 RepID=A0AAJ0QTK9_ACIBA|nr:hypothetical protein LV35_04177 [Acinetobacter baumannii]